MSTYKVYGTTFYCDPNYSFIGAIGRGAYGVVAAAKHRASGEKVAIKKISPMARSAVDAKHTLREIRLMRHLGRHKNIISLRDLYMRDKQDEIYIVEDFYDTDLHKVIQSDQKLTEAHFKHFMFQLLRAVSFFRAHDVLHRDLKPGNLLTTRNCDLVVSDFGLARVEAEEESKMTEHVVTRWYRPPELMLCPDGQYDSSVDMWSVGCIFAEMLGRRPLFPGKNFIHQLTLIFDVIGAPDADEVDYIRSSEAQRFLRSQASKAAVPWARVYPAASQEALDLIGRMLVFHPPDRITVEEALRHPFFADVRLRYQDPGLVDPTVFEFDFEEAAKDSRKALRDLIIAEVDRFADLRATATSARSRPGSAASAASSATSARSRPISGSTAASRARAAAAARATSRGSGTYGTGSTRSRSRSRSRDRGRTTTTATAAAAGRTYGPQNAARRASRSRSGSRDPPARRRAGIARDAPALRASGRQAVGGGQTASSASLPRTHATGTGGGGGAVGTAAAPGAAGAGSLGVRGSGRGGSSTSTSGGGGGVAAAEAEARRLLGEAERRRGPSGDRAHPAPPSKVDEAEDAGFEGRQAPAPPSKVDETAQFATAPRTPQRRPAALAAASGSSSSRRVATITSPRGERVPAPSPIRSRPEEGAPDDGTGHATNFDHMHGSGSGSGRRGRAAADPATAISAATAALQGATLSGEQAARRRPQSGAAAVTSVAGVPIAGRRARPSSAAVAGDAGAAAAAAESGADAAGGARAGRTGSAGRRAPLVRRGSSKKKLTVPKSPSFSKMSWQRRDSDGGAR